MSIRYGSLTTRAATLAIAFVAVAACGRKDSGAVTDTAGGAIGAPAGATAANAVRVSDVDIGRKVDADKKISDKADEFKPNETIYASVHTTGMGPSGTLTAKWMYQDGQVVDSTSAAITPNGDTYTEFHVTKPSGWPAGKYSVHILWNGQDVSTKDFEVKK